jgi:hypothetical protein
MIDQGVKIKITIKYRNIYKILVSILVNFEQRDLSRKIQKRKI